MTIEYEDLTAALAKARQVALAESAEEIARLRAEVAALREALEGLMVGSVWKDAHVYMDGTPLPGGWDVKQMPSDEALTKARAALRAAGGEDG